MDPSPRRNLGRRIADVAVGTALAGALTLIYVGDFLWGEHSAPRSGAVVVQDEPMPPALNEPEFKVVIQDEPDEQGPVAPVARYKIEDEPEERFGKQPVVPVKVEIKDEPDEVGPGKSGGKNAPIDPTRRIQYAYDNIKNWGLVDALNNKKLTFATQGGTNRTIVRILGRGQSFPPFGDFRTLPDEPAREAKQRSSYTFAAAANLKITQLLEVVPSKQPVDIGGKQRRLMDTLLVRYLYENTGRLPINTGLRLEIDTLIGGNDGVPFTVPGRGLVNTWADFTRPQDVPDFVQALETGSLQSPGTVVHISLKVGGGLEAPSRVLLCHWATNGDLSNPRATPMGNDSAIILVWPDKLLGSGKKREMGYAYGLGAVTAADPGGTLAVTLGGNFDIGQSFTITAYVNKPAPGQTLSLDMPAGLERIKGDQTQRVPAPTVGTNSIVSWEAKVLQTGVFPVKVRSSTGLTQTKIITIAQGNAPTGGKLRLDLQGSFEPGQTFNVIAKVEEPLADQKLTLHLPAGLKRVDGADTLPVPAPPAGAKESLVQWQVRVEQPGKYPVRVSSSTGVAQTKTITIVQAGRAEGYFQIVLNGDFTPGKAFSVATTVASPAPDQALTLLLPAGLERLEGDATQKPKAGVLLAWKVKILEAGKFSIGVKSTTGVTQRKTVRIEPPADQAGRFNFDITGEIRPGKEIAITAKVMQPAAGQTLTLTLPAGLVLLNGDVTQSVPPASPDGASSVSWSVQVARSGQLPVRVASSTGLARTKTIVLSETTKTLLGN